MTANSGGRSVAKAIWLGVLICGTLDLTDALVFYWLRARVTPLRLLQSIASGLLGKSAFSGGVGTAALGVAIHYCIAACWVAAFVLLAQRVRWMRAQPFVAGVLYGLLVYGVMNFLVLPMTRVTPSKGMSGIILVNAVGALVLFIGLGVAIVNARFAP